MSFYLLRPCKSTAAFECVPKKSGKIDLAVAETGLGAAGYAVKNARVLLIAQKAGVETTIYPSGKLIIKTRDESAASAEASAIYRAMGIVA